MLVVRSCDVKRMGVGQSSETVYNGHAVRFFEHTYAGNELVDRRLLISRTFLHGVLHRLGKAALVEVGNVKIILCSIRVQPADRAALHLFGLEPETCPVVAVKSAVHYRASYEPVAGRILEVSTKSLGPIDPRALHYEHAPKDAYPLQGLDL